MRVITQQLKDALATGKRCYLVKITTKQNVVYGFTNHDRELDYDGDTYIPTPGLKNLESYYTDSAEVSSSQFEMAFTATIDVDEVLMQSGIFDNAEYLVMRVAWSDLAAGHYVHDTGHLAGSSWNEVKVKHESQSFQRDLAKPIGAVYTAQCPHEFGNTYSDDLMGACTINAATYTSPTSVDTVSSIRMKFTIPSTGEVDGWFSNGVVTWTSGDNIGLSYPIKTHVVGGTEEITLFIPTFLTIQSGDTFDIIAGCDKTFEQCRDKYNNAVNFGAFPWINPGINRR